MQTETASFPLIEPKEQTYYTILLVFSILIWAVVAVTIVGIFYAAMFALMFWLGHGLLVAGLRAEGVEVTPQQMPDLHASLLSVCSRLGVEKIPRLYVIQSGGLLNAFTTRHADRDFIVLYSDIVEAYGADSAEMRFVLGHEIGHIRQRHLLKDILLLPGRLLPLIGNAYSRARESTCDRHGAHASGDIQGAVTAMMILSGGKDYGRKMIPEHFASQYFSDRGFFVSWHELMSGYPTLCRRVSDLIALREGTPQIKAGRSPLAYFFALFTPSGAGGGGLIIMVAVIALLAAIAVPSFIRARERAQAVQAVSQIKNEGTRPQEFLGVWNGGTPDPGDGSDYTAWTSTRSSNGDFITVFRSRVDGEESTSTTRGTWTVVNDRFVEIAENEEPAYLDFALSENAKEIQFKDEERVFKETKVEE